MGKSTDKKNHHHSSAPEFCESIQMCTQSPGCKAIPNGKKNESSTTCTELIAKHLGLLKVWQCMTVKIFISSEKPGLLLACLYVNEYTKSEFLEW